MKLFSMDYFRIGLFLRPHGVRGEVKILPLTDDLRRFSKLHDAYVEQPNNKYQPVTVHNARISGENAVIVKLDGIDSMDSAEKLRNAYLCVDRLHAVELPEGSYFIKDMIGCRVVSSDGIELGIMDDIYETNANDVYVVKGKKTLSVPALKRLLRDVDIESKLIVFDADVLAEVGLFED